MREKSQEILTQLTQIFSVKSTLVISVEKREKRCLHEIFCQKNVRVIFCNFHDV